MGQLRTAAIVTSPSRLLAALHPRARWSMSDRKAASPRLSLAAAGGIVVRPFDWI